MKICLISPPTITEFTEREMAESEARRIIAEHAPMGILSLAAVLEGQGLKPHVIDLNRLYYKYLKESPRNQDATGFVPYVIETIGNMPFDIFGFSTICSSYPLTLRLAREMKFTYPRAKTILGGPQASVVDVQTMKVYPYVDFIVRGEAEMTLPLLLDAISQDNADLAQIGGLTYRSNGDVIRNPNAPVIENLDTLPMPAFHLYPYMHESSFAPLEAGRGCPFACSFCSTNDFFRRRFRMKSPQVLVQQMRLIKESYGISAFDLVHDLFNVDRKKVISFCEEIERSGEKFYWNCSARTDCLDDELIARMAHAGCVGVFFGIDSGSERMQKIIDKRLDLPNAISRVKWVSRNGMKPTVSLITGFPEETKDDLRDSVRFFAESLRFKNTELQLHLLAPLAETPITSRYKDELVYDQIFSDISFLGWEPDPEDREMIVAHRDIFPNFYAVPTRWLDRHYLKELREFLLRVSIKHRQLLLLLYRDAGDLLQVFDEWKLWSSGMRNASAGESIRDYYRSLNFSQDLLSFVSTHYLKTMARHPHLVKTLLELELAVLPFSQGGSASLPPRSRRAGEKPYVLKLDAVPRVADDVRMIQVEADYKRLMRCLRRKEHLERIPFERMTLALQVSKREIRVMQLNQASHRLLSLCDGSRNVMEIADNFLVTEQVSPIKATLYGLASLTSQGLIDISAAAAAY